MRASEAYREYFCESSLRCLFFERVLGGHAVGLDRITPLRFADDIDREIAIVLRKVGNSSYQFTPYRLLLSSKGKGCIPRELNIPTVRDRLVLAALSQLLDDVYGIACRTCQPQLVVERVRECVESGRYAQCLKIDIRRFYSSIPHDKLMRTIRKRIRKKEVLRLIEDAIRTPSSPIGEKASEQRDEGVPEGLSISNRLANIFVESIDAAFAGDSGVSYFRYVDDILLFCSDDEAKIAKSKLNGAISKLGLTINEEKTHLVNLRSDSLDYLGYIFEPSGCLTVRSSTVKRLEKTLDDKLRKMRGIVDHVSPLQHINNRITGCRITEDGVNFERYGWLHYYSRIDDIGLLCRLDSLIRKLIDRYDLPIQQDTKSFKKAYYEIKYKANRTKYIPTYDMNAPKEVKLRDLKLLFPSERWDDLDDTMINLLYSRRIRSMANQLEKDLGLIS